jgi:hypothetical protein
MLSENMIQKALLPDRTEVPRCGSELDKNYLQMAESIEKVALVWQGKENISKTSELLCKSIAHPNRDSVTILPNSSYCMDRKGADNDFDTCRKLGMPLKSVSPDQPPGWNDPYRSHNLESVFPAFREKRLAVEIVSAKLKGVRIRSFFLLIHWEDSAAK